MKLFYFYQYCLHINPGKKTSLEIPDYIKSDKNYLINFIRGVFDTDGCITSQKSGKYNYPLIKISTQHLNFATQISESLNILSIKNHITKTKANKEKGRPNDCYDVVVRNKNIFDFLNKIKSRNPRNLNKLDLILKEIYGAARI